MCDLKIIEQLFLFKGLDYKFIENRFHISKNAIIVEYKPDEIILSASDIPFGIGIVLDGCATITTSVLNNAPKLRKLTQGDTFGAASLFKNYKDYSTTVVADKQTTIAYIDKQIVRLLCECVPQIAINYIEFLSDRVAFLNSKISTFSTPNTDARIAYYIYTLVEGQEKDATLPFTYSQLAENLGIGRASLYRALDNLCTENIIERDNKTLKVKSIEKLKKYFN